MHNHSAQPRMRRLTRTTAVGLLLAAGSAQAPDIRTFDIPRGDLATVLTRIALAAKVSIAFPAELACGRTAGPIQGREVVEAALTRALAGTDLEIGWIGRRSLTVRLVSPPPATEADGLVLASISTHPEVAGRGPDCASDASVEAAADVSRAVP